MKEQLELIEQLNEDYFNKTSDDENAFSLETDGYNSLIKFGGVTLYNSGLDSLITDTGEDKPLLTHLKESWKEYVKSVKSIKPF